MHNIIYLVEPTVSNAALNTLFAGAWPNHRESDFQRIMSRSLTYIGAFTGKQMVGFVNVAWDGGVHAFLLDTTVHPDFQRQGIGARLVQEAASVARERGMHWLHVDYESHLDSFYRACGFTPTLAGVMRLKADDTG